WSFLPWSAFALWALGRRIIGFWNKGTSGELLTVGGFILPLIALSFSRYKLPHYIFPLYPLMAILVAKEILSLMKISNSRLFKVFLSTQVFINVLIWALVFILCIFVFPTDIWWLWALIVIAFVVYGFYLLHPKMAAMRLVAPTL